MPENKSATQTQTPSENEAHRWITQALAFSLGKVTQNMLQLNEFPEQTRGDKWDYVPNGGWVGGHWIGLLWLAFALTGDKIYEQEARKWAARLAFRQYDTTTHDMGFLFELSHVLGANLTGDSALKTPAIQAARSLTMRFNKKGKFIQAWGALDASPTLRGGTIIDTMMNLDLLFWASRETSEPHFAEQAAEQAKTCLMRQIRSDYSSSHGASFDPDTGKFIGQTTHQGLSATSCWSRGHSWAIYGYTDCYRATGDALYLFTAHSLADYALNRLPADLVPFWDYNSPLIPHDVRDSSAGSILASALLHLASVEPDDWLSRRWASAAENILHSLWESYTSRESVEPSLLIHATRSKPEGFLDRGLIYGDYYFVEGLLRLLDPGLAKTLH